MMVTMAPVDCIMNFRSKNVIGRIYKSCCVFKFYRREERAQVMHFLFRSNSIIKRITFELLNFRCPFCF